MLQVKNENETTFDSNQYKNHATKSNLNEPMDGQNIVSYTPHIIDNKSNQNNTYQNLKKNTTAGRKNLDNPTSFRKSKKIKIFNHQTMKFIS